MEIDLFTFIAQMVNFLILIWLLNKFLFGAVARAMDAREQKIAEEIKQAELKNARAEELEAKNTELRKLLSDKADEMLLEAKEKAEQEKLGMLETAKLEAEKVKETWNRDIQSQKQGFLDLLRERSGDFVCDAAARALRDLADENLEKRVAEVFVRRIKELGDDAAGRICDLIEKSQAGLNVRSSFEIPHEIKTRIHDVVSERIRAGTEIFFQPGEGEIYGIELVIDGYRVSWSVREYLNGLEEKLGSVFEPEKKQDKGKKR
jgi:F-type H+-transporting ATPase subunit b